MQDVYFLDGELFYLGENLEGNFYKLNLLESPDKKVLLVFTTQNLARQLFPEQPLLVLPKDDFRAKEDFFRAALETGATEIWVDSLQPQICIPVQQALDYVLSFKNQRACL